MDYYIVRIYDRRPEEGRLVGTVEDAEGRQGRAFQTPEHLLCFLWGCVDGAESGGPDADCPYRDG